MLHIDYLKERGSDDAGFVKRASGRYYTGEVVGRQLAVEVAIAFHSEHPSARKIKVVDPFGGDGRLIAWLFDAWGDLGFPKVQWDVSLWDLDDVGFSDAKTRLIEASKRNNHRFQVDFQVVDAFAQTFNSQSAYDLVITNPPWELLKPDSRELAGLGSVQRKRYIAKMRLYDDWLARHFPLSQPKRKFAGWGTNLSRVGLEASLFLVRSGGIVGAVLPASFLADDQTASLREHLLTEHKLLSAAYYPAEAKLYESADTASISISILVDGEPANALTIGTHSLITSQLEFSEISLDQEALRRIDFVMPISFGAKALAIINGLAQHFPAWRELESDAPDSLWAGREIDETRISDWLKPIGGIEPLFIKGRMIGRYKTIEQPTQIVRKPNWSTPASTKARRIAWRDVSRPSQKRRMIATLIDSGSVAGNSLGVAYFKDMSETPLLGLLGVMNSTCFEFQLRAHLATGHVSLSTLRKVAVPCLQRLREANVLALMVKAAIDAEDESAVQVDAYIAKFIYEISEDEYKTILNGFTGITPEERRDHLLAYNAFSNSVSDRRRFSARVVNLVSNERIAS